MRGMSMIDLLAANQSTGSPTNWPALVVTAVVSIVVSVGSAWLIFQLVKKREMAEGLRIEIEKLELVKKPELAQALLNEIEGQREKLRLEQEKDRNERIRAEILRWANPILGAVEDLNRRLANILRQRGYFALNPAYKETSQWSISYDYFMQSTLYLFSVYFAYAEALQEELSFELFRDQEEKKELFSALVSVGKALGDFPPSYSCTGGDRQVFHLEQRSIGSVVLREDDRTRCISYPAFRDKLSDDKFSLTLSPLQKLLESVEPGPGNCRWKRLEAVDAALTQVDEVCRKILQPRDR
jgi:hypothetical protein